MASIFPRAEIELSVVVAFGGSLQESAEHRATRVGGTIRQVNTPVTPDSVTLGRRSHSHAATCDVTVRGGALPFDPELVESGFIAVFLADGNEMDGDVREERFLRFVGEIDEFTRENGERGPTIRIKARDLSALLREAKPLDPAAIPKYSDTLEQAIQRLLDSVLSRLVGADGNSLMGTLSIKKTSALATADLGSLVAKPHRKGFVPLPKGDMSAWDVIEHICGMTARLVSVVGREVVVRQPTEVFGSDGRGENQAPSISFLFGAEDDALPNAPAPIVPALSVAMTRKLRSRRRGVSCIAWSPSLRQKIQVDYPDGKDLPSKRLPAKFTEKGAFDAAKKRNKGVGGHGGATGHAASTAQAKAKFIKSDDRDPFYIREVHTIEALREVAKRIWLERSRQELEGRIETAEWTEGLLALQNGDRITVHVSPDIEQALRSDLPDDDKIEFLVARLGVTEKAAAVLINAAAQSRDHLFYVKAVTLTWSKGDKPSVGIDFINLLNINLKAG